MRSKELYRRLYAGLANLYRASDRVQIDEEFPSWRRRPRCLKTDAEFSAAICVEFPHRPGEYVSSPATFTPATGRSSSIRKHPPRVGDSPRGKTQRILRTNRSRNISTKVFAPLLFEATAQFNRRIADRRQSVSTSSAAACRDGRRLLTPQTNSDDLILEQAGNWRGSGTLLGFKNCRVRPWRSPRQYRLSGNRSRTCSTCWRGALAGSGEMRCALVVGLLVFALGGCASQSVSISKPCPPGRDPAAENAGGRGKRRGCVRRRPPRRRNAGEAGREAQGRPGSASCR